MAEIGTEMVDARFDELWKEVSRLRGENERLAAEVDCLRSKPPRRERRATSEPDGADADLSRRMLLRRLGGAAVAGAGLAVGASALSPQIAAASAGAPPILGRNNDAQTA